MGFLDRFKSQQSKDPTNPDLVRAMDAVANNDNPQTRQILYKNLLKSILLIPRPFDKRVKKARKRIAKRDTQVNIYVEKNAEGQLIMPVFTDTKSLLKWRSEDCNYLGLQGSDLFSMALTENIFAIIVNPAGPIGGEINREEINMLAHGYINSPYTLDLTQAWIPGGAEYKYRFPTEKLQPELVGLLQKSLFDCPIIVAGYLLEMVIEQSEPHFLLAVVLSEPLNSQQIEENLSILMKNIQELFKEKYIRLYILKRNDTFIDINVINPIFTRY